MVIQSAVIDGDRHGDIDDAMLMVMILGIFSPQFDRVGHQKNGLTIAANRRNAKSITPKYVSKYISHFLLHITTNHMLQPIRLPQLGW